MKMARLADIQMQVMWNRLISVVEEQAQTLIRTAFGAATREAGDLSAGVFLPDGRMVAQAVTGTPGHVNSMAESVKHFLHEYPPQDMFPGDVFLTNDPWKGTGHLNDLTMVTPVFKGRRMVALFASTVHVVDIGGIGLSADGTQVYHEGLFIPIIRLVSKGTIDETMLKVVRANVREPVQVEGDIYGLIACNEIGGRRLLAMMDEYRLSNIEALSEHIISRSKAAMLAAVREWPKGTWSYSMTTDGYDAPVVLVGTLTVSNRGIDIDFTGSSDVVGNGINVPKSYTDAYASFGVRCVIGPHIPNNAGSLSAIRITAPEGSIVNAPHPLAVAARSTIGQMLPDVVFGCLRQARVDRVPAEGASSLWNIRLAGGQVMKGIEPAQIRGATRFNVVGFNTGGTGARPGKDGLSVTSFPSGIRNVAVEIMETLSPVVYWKKEYRPDSGGAGEHRGGLGQVMEISSGEDVPMIISATFDRIVHPARGNGGGGDGGAGRLSLKSGAKMRGFGRQPIPAGDRVVVETPGGAGIGDPKARPHALVERDVRDGLVTPAQAKALYGL
ncbi:MAG: hydantoinase B/oxoprolinase family protein [bacterium]|jgi:N-methylhydantoinase B|nr:hydantoinase B/oxoprolinase family protein [Betaproteobacteria bacterium]